MVVNVEKGWRVAGIKKPNDSSIESGVGKSRHGEATIREGASIRWLKTHDYRGGTMPPVRNPECAVIKIPVITVRRLYNGYFR